MKVRVLGCSGAIARDCRTTAFLIDQDTLIDAGTGVGDLTREEMLRIEDVFLTHSHLDHVACLPLMVDSVGAARAGLVAFADHVEVAHLEHAQGQHTAGKQHGAERKQGQGSEGQRGVGHGA